VNDVLAEVIDLMMVSLYLLLMGSLRDDFSVLIVAFCCSGVGRKRSLKAFPIYGASLMNEECGQYVAPHVEQGILCGLRFQSNLVPATNVGKMQPEY
jgi:hypothetical protein